MQVLNHRLAVALLLSVGLWACAPTPDGPDASVTLPPLSTSTRDANAFAVEVLDRLQPRSIAESREYCGLILRSPDGGFVTSSIVSGGEDYCEMPSVIGSVVASFHTHGSYSPDYENEVPSVTDVLGDFGQRIDGYVGTPGGRVWHVDYEPREIILLCGLGCIYADPNDDPSDVGFIPVRMTLPELRDRFF